MPFESQNARQKKKRTFWPEEWSTERLRVVLERIPRRNALRAIVRKLRSCDSLSHGS